MRKRFGTERSSALWGARSGGSRASALWGRGGRGVAIAAAAGVTVLVVPLASAMQSGTAQQTFVAPGLLKQAVATPDATVRVIVQSASGSAAAESAFRGVAPYGQLKRSLPVVGGVAVELKAKLVERLAQVPGLTVTLDAPVRPTSASGSFSSSQMWPFEAGVAKLWPTSSTPVGTLPTIAIVDSGIDANRADFDNGARVYPQVNLSSLTPTATGDGRGHGTFVAGIAAGSAASYAGAAPTAKILPIRVMDDHGMAMTSDVIAAAQWILANKAQYNIRVANFSLHATNTNHFWLDPLDRAVEKLWFNGVFVVAAAGNYGSPTGPSGVMYAPGNDPFVMTVGAVDLGNSVGLGNDSTAPWSAYGYTEDGFAKPEIGAPGRFMVGPVPASSTLVAERPGNVAAPGYMELSGTSFAAPVVAGAAARLLASHPTWTPDQLKGALMLTAKPAPQATNGSIGVGEVNAGKADALTATPPNANAAIDAFLGTDPVLGTVFNNASWTSAVQANASWASASWTSASWTSASWTSASWSAASWASASWASSAYADASWASSAVATTDTSSEDAAEADDALPAYVQDATADAEVAADPDLALPQP